MVLSVLTSFIVETGKIKFTILLTCALFSETGFFATKKKTKNSY